MTKIIFEQKQVFAKGAYKVEVTLPSFTGKYQINVYRKKGDKWEVVDSAQSGLTFTAKSKAKKMLAEQGAK